MKVRLAGRDELGSASTAAVRDEAARRRDEQLRRALNLAATQPASDVVVVEPTGDEELTTIRAALGRLFDVEPRALNWGVRGGRIVISKGPLPPRSRRSIAE
jgi:hypothetical protein